MEQMNLSGRASQSVKRRMQDMWRSTRNEHYLLLAGMEQETYPSVEHCVPRYENSDDT